MMTRSNTTKIKVFWMDNSKEKSVTIKSKNVPEMKWENGFELYHWGLSEVCQYFKYECPEDVMRKFEWCYEFIPTSSIDPDLTWEQKKKILSSEEYQYWLRLKIESLAYKCTESMFSDAYKYLIEACKHHNNGEDVDEVDLDAKKWKEPFWISYLFDEYIGYQDSYVPTGAWIFPDGSYITVESGNHRRIVEEYMNLKEQEVERSWIKIQLYKAYTHNKMTDAQKKTLNKFFKQYDDLYEVDIDKGW